MKSSSRRVFFNVFAALVFLVSANLAQAKDVPVDAKSVLGHWLLLDVKTKDAESRAFILAAKLDMTFRDDNSLIVINQNPEAPSGTETHKSTYLVQNGKIVVKHEGAPPEEPARAVIRDGKFLVFMPTDKFPGEMIFARASK